MMTFTPSRVPAGGSKTMGVWSRVGAAIAKNTAKIEPGYFKAWINDYSYFPGAVSAEDKKAMTLVWSQSRDMGILKKVPDVEKAIWRDAIKE